MTKSGFYTSNNSHSSGWRTQQRKRLVPVLTGRLTALPKNASSTPRKLSLRCLRLQVKTVVSNPLRVPRRLYANLLPSFRSYAEEFNSRQQATPVMNPAHWTSVKAALIQSIRNGVFFDRVYWARHSKAGDLLKPVYISSVIMGDKAQQLKKCSSKLIFWYTRALSVPSGKILQGSRSSSG